MSRPGEEDHSAGGAALTISSELMVAAVIFLFMVVVFVFFLYLYAKHYMASSSSRRRGGRRGAHFIFPASELPPNHRRRGLDAQVLRALPVTVFRPADFKDGLECAVCLAELSEGEKLRQLPECNHGFHVDCIDMWFQSHSTCPLCRSSVGMNSDSGAEPAAEGAEPLEAEASPVFPTNVLFWGTHDRVNNMRGLAVAGEANTCTPPAHQSSLVIEIPRRAVAVEGFPSPMTPLPSSRFPAEEMKSPKGGSGSGSGSSSGASATFKSLKRLLSQGKRAIESSWSPRGGDIEEGLGGGTASGEGSSSLGPKSPTSS